MSEFTVTYQTGNTRFLTGKDFSIDGFFGDRSCVIITDSNVMKIYGSKLEKVPVIELPAGESSKSLEMFNYICNRLLELRADRTTVMIGFGGGVVTDITGFVASVFLRGTEFGFIPTTLLAQCDAAIGGKNALNFNTWKNIIGTVNQPAFVVCDTNYLQTLAKEEYLSGFAEIIKIAALCDGGLFSYLEEHSDSLMNSDSDLLARVIEQSVKLKTAIVRQDEKESGLRRILNFGHTFAHAAESVSGIRHGYAVMAGMIKSAEISYKLGLADSNLKKRLMELAEKYNLPSEIDFDIKNHFEAVFYDKKREKNQINFVLLEDIGKPTIRAISAEKLRDLL